MLRPPLQPTLCLMQSRLASFASPLVRDLFSETLISLNGFAEVQTIAAQRWGIMPKVTCKNASRKDQIWISRELQDLLVQVDVERCWFPDHDLLIASFAGGATGVCRLLWRTPQPLDRRCQSEDWCLAQGESRPVPVISDPSVEYLGIWME